MYMKTEEKLPEDYTGMQRVFMLLFSVFGLWGCEAFVASMLWGWFIVPLGAQGLTFVHAYGVVLLVSMVTYKYSPKRSLDYVHVVSSHIELYVLVLALGSIARFFM